MKCDCAFGASGLVFAADLTTRERLLQVCGAVRPYVVAIKLSSLVLYELGWGVIKDVKATTGRPVLADLKLMEVPFMAERLCLRAIDSGVDALMVCGSSGFDTLCYCRAAFPRPLFVVTQFSHCQDVITDEQADRIIDLALRVECDGIQIPGTLPSRIRSVRQRVKSDLEIISCGVGRQGPDVGSAMASGADYEIVGRAIYEPDGDGEADLVAIERAASELRTRAMAAARR